ncbi:MAG: hypothetical protein WCB68_15460 [Pyrinomonadaceae bacterium]
MSYYLAFSLLSGQIALRPDGCARVQAHVANAGHILYQIAYFILTVIYYD